jgi:predicted GNAT family N-acyltransferase
LDGDFKIEPLGSNHDRAAFSCGKEPLDNYLKTQARKAIEKNLAAVFVYTDGAKIAGYYTLSSFAVKLDEIPEALAKKLTKMPLVPATLIGRLARNIEFRGKGIGEILLVDALKKAYRNSKEVASWAVIVDAKDAEAIAFYKRFGFVEFSTVESRMFLPMISIADLFVDNSVPDPAAPESSAPADASRS